MTSKPVEFCQSCEDRPATELRVFLWGATPGSPAFVRDLCPWCVGKAAGNVTLLRTQFPVPNDDREWN